jgi:hypothetical protein
MCDSLNVMQGENLKVQYGYTGTCSTYRFTRTTRVPGTQHVLLL